MMINLLTAFLIGLFFPAALAGLIFLLWRLSGALVDQVTEGGAAATFHTISLTFITCGYVGLLFWLVQKI